MSTYSAPSLEILAFTGLELTLGGAVLVLLFAIWCLTRHQECRSIEAPEGRLGDHLQALAGNTHSNLTTGNDITIIQDEAFFDRLLADFAEARDSINFEAFLWKAGDIADRTTEALTAAAKRGVAVRLLVDARGSSGMGSERQRLKEAGCKVGTYHRWRPRNIGRFNVRDHRKTVVIDGRIAYVGGHCFADEWMKDTESTKRFRDTTARFTGPVVAEIQATFLENWSEVTREYLLSHRYFPELSPTGRSTAHVVSVKADGCPSGVQVLHYAAIAFARERIRIQNPYFLPDPRGVQALVDAAKRGVDVRIMTPGVGATDNPIVARASQFTFARLLDGGVRIFEYQRTLLHQKIITIDGEWCGVGSSNFDDRSFEINDEITVGVVDSAIVGQLDQAFESDAGECEELKAADWKRRSWKDKAVAWVFYLFKEQF